MTARPVATPPLPPVRRDAGGAARSDITNALVLVAVLAVVGALTGLLWAAWSPHGPRALILRPGVYIPDETESFVAGDGRFLVFGAALGLIAALAVWFRRSTRGVASALALTVGGLAGSLLMWLVGHLTGGGDSTGRAIPGSTERYSARLPLTVHAHGLLLVQAAVSALVYGLLVAFAVHDDLGRADPVRDALTSQPADLQLADLQLGYPPTAYPPIVSPPSGYYPEDPSVGAGPHPQDGWGDRNAPGPLQQRDLPPQEPGQPDQSG